MRDLCFTSATELIRLYRTRKVSPVEAMEAILGQVDRVNPHVNAIVTLARESALRAARAATRALSRAGELPPLFGVPVTIKDLTVTKGLRTTYGSTIYADHVPAEDALVVQRLKAAGAIVLGKTNTPEFGAGANTFNAVFGATRNPWNLARTCGGSSGGSAVALATGMGPLAHGSDLGGSLRIPAAFCGVVGFRTTPGLVPVYPRELAWDQFSVHGPMARTVADTALMLSAIAGPDDRSPISYPVDTREFVKAVRTPSVRGWRVAWTPDLDGLIPVDSEVAAVAEQGARVFRSLGARVEAASPNFAETNDIVLSTRGLMMATLHAEKLPRWRARMQQGLVWNIEQGLTAHPAGDRPGGEAPDDPLAPGADLLRAVRPADPADGGREAVSGGAAVPCGDQRAGAHELHPVVLPHLCHLADRLARHLHPLRLHAGRPAGGAADCRPTPPRSRRPPGRRGVRAGGALGGPGPADRRRPTTLSE